MQKNFGYKIEFAILGLVLSALTLLFSLLGAFEPLVSFSIASVGSIQGDIREFDLGWQKFITSMGDIGNMIERSDNNYQENLALKARIVELQALQVELEKVIKQEKILPEYELIYARIIYFAEDGKYIRISKGQDAGLSVGSVVVWNNYLVGSISEVGANHSTVELIRANSNIISVKILADNQNALLQFLPGKGFQLKDLPRSYKFEAGKEVITLGVNSLFPYGLSLGQTTKLLSAESDISQTVEITYPLDIAKLEEVYIIKK